MLQVQVLIYCEVKFTSYSPCKLGVIFWSFSTLSVDLCYTLLELAILLLCIATEIHCSHY